MPDRTKGASIEGRIEAANFDLIPRNIYRDCLHQLRVQSPAYPLACAFFQAAGGMPTILLNARENAASDS